MSAIGYGKPSPGASDLAFRVAVSSPQPEAGRAEKKTDRLMARGYGWGGSDVRLLTWEAAALRGCLADKPAARTPDFHPNQNRGSPMLAG